MKSREAQEQAVVISWCEMQSKKYFELEMIYHCPNGGYRNKIEAANLKRQGVKSGVPDLFLPIPRRNKDGLYHGLYIEMKWGKNKCTPNQNKWILRLSKLGYKVKVCYSSIEAIDTIKEYLGMK